MSTYTKTTEQNLAFLDDLQKHKDKKDNLGWIKHLKYPCGNVPKLRCPIRKHCMSTFVKHHELLYHARSKNDKFIREVE